MSWTAEVRQTDRASSLFAIFFAFVAVIMVTFFFSKLSPQAGLQRILFYIDVTRIKSFTLVTFQYLDLSSSFRLVLDLSNPVSARRLVFARRPILARRRGFSPKASFLPEGEFYPEG